MREIKANGYAKPVHSHSRHATWDIFCAVVDNYGDIGVCWRLARQLAAEHGLHPRLWVDQPQVFARLCPQVDPQRACQQIDGVQVRHWCGSLAGEQPAEVVIEAFGCPLPAPYLQAMAAAARPPAWINLEYLSAQSWVEGCHRLPSPHPRLPLRQHYYYPGFTAATGGLLRETGLIAQRQRFQADPAARAAFLAALGVTAGPPDALSLSLFSYAEPQLAALLQTWAEGPRPIHCLLPAGRLLAPLAVWAGQTGTLAAGAEISRGALRVSVLPFLPQPDYDRLLWSCDANFVRGEDSLVRALWAARPLIWQAYPQAGETRRSKLDAWLARWAEGLAPAPRAALIALHHAWNADADSPPAALAPAWHAWLTELPALAEQARARCAAWAAAPDLAAGLVDFCNTLLE